MRTCAIVVCIAAVVASIYGISDEQKNRIKAFHNECQADPKTHVDEDILKKFYSGEHVDKSVVGAHMLCMSKKFGIVDENGKINKPNLKKSLARAISDETKLHDAVEKCAVDKDDPQETAIDLGRCYRDHAGVVEHYQDHHN